MNGDNATLFPPILAVACVNPPYPASMEAVAQQAQAWLQDQPIEMRQKADKIFRKAGVANRYTVLPLEQLFSPMTLDETNGLYRQLIVNYAETALRNALQKAQVEAAQIDCLITTSCTGHMSPSMDAFLINRLGLKNSVQRLPVMAMGCAGGVTALIYAENYLRAYPGRTVAVIAAELTSLTFQREDFSWANIVSTAIFGDGIACAILGPSPKPGPAIMGSQMHHFADTTDLLGFNLSGTGFRMVLDPALPETIRAHFPAVMQQVLAPLDLALADIDTFMVHPGGKKILHDVETLLRPLGKDVEASWDILRRYGNMSSATVLFILEQMMAKPQKAGSKALMLAFGPGLTAASVVLQWQ